MSTAKLDAEQLAYSSADVKIAQAFSKRGDRLIGQEMFKVLDRAKRLEQDGTHIYHLELGNPRMAPPKEMIDAIIEALQNRNVGYTSSAGLPVLREAIANRYTQHVGRKVDAENVVVSTANLLISQFLDLTCEQGDRVVLFTPTFPTFLAATAHIGLEVVEVPLDVETGFDLTEEHVEQAVAAHPKAIIVNSANNPTCAVYTAPVMELLARRCEEEGIWLLSDETYAELSYGRPFYSLADVSLPRVVTLSSFSKIFSVPGFRTGYAIAHKTVAEKLALSNSTLISCLPAFTQLACVAGLKVIDKYVAGIRTHFIKAASESTAQLNQSGLLRCPMPQSGFYIFVNIENTGLDDMEFSKRLLEERHTTVTPGRSFGETYRNFIRIAVCGKYEDVEEGVDRVVGLVRDLVR